MNTIQTPQLKPNAEFSQVFEIANTTQNTAKTAIVLEKIVESTPALSNYIQVTLKELSDEPQVLFGPAPIFNIVSQGYTTLSILQAHRSQKYELVFKVDQDIPKTYQEQQFSFDMKVGIETQAEIAQVQPSPTPTPQATISTTSTTTAAASPQATPQASPSITPLTKKTAQTLSSSSQSASISASPLVLGAFDTTLPTPIAVVSPTPVQTPALLQGGLSQQLLLILPELLMFILILTLLAMLRQERQEKKNAS